MNTNRFGACVITVSVMIAIAAPVLADAGDTDAAWWQLLSSGERSVYLMGFHAGIGHGLVGAKNFLRDAGYLKRGLSPGDQDRFAKLNWPPVTFPVLSDGISELYRDSLNAYVLVGDAVLITLDRLQGRDVEMRLRTARKFGLELYQRRSTSAVPPPRSHGVAGEPPK